MDFLFCSALFHDVSCLYMFHVRTYDRCSNENWFCFAWQVLRGCAARVTSILRCIFVRRRTTPQRPAATYRTTSNVLAAWWRSTTGAQLPTKTDRYVSRRDFGFGFGSDVPSRVIRCSCWCCRCWWWWLLLLLFLSGQAFLGHCSTFNDPGVFETTWCHRCCRGKGTPLNLQWT